MGAAIVWRLVGEAMRTCEDCTFCCKVMAVTELNKAPGVWCSDCVPGHGCKIYDDRPAGCRDFECFWLQSGNFPEGQRLHVMPEEMRPDRVKAVFGGNNTNPHLVMLYVDPVTPRHWRENRTVLGYVEYLRKAFSVVVVWGDNRTVLPAYTEEGSRYLTQITTAIELP